MSWSIEYNGKRQSFEEWGVRNGIRSLVSLDIDTFAFDAVRGIDEADLFPRGSIIKVFKDEVQWFAGRIDQTPRAGRSESESHTYVAVGPWWYLANLVYQQTWSELADPLAGPASGYVAKYRSHLLLGYDVNGNFLSTRSVILDALNYCLACAEESGIEAPFQIGDISIG